MTMDDVLLHPEWRRALTEIMALDPQPGDIIPRAWIEEMLDLPADAETMAQFQARQLKWLRQFDRLRDELLVRHKIWLRASGDGGYEVVPPARQTDLAYADYSRAAFLKLKRMAHVSRNVDLLALTDQERAANRDTLSKIATLVGMVGVAMIENKRPDEEGEG